MKRFSLIVTAVLVVGCSEARKAPENVSTRTAPNMANMVAPAAASPPMTGDAAEQKATGDAKAGILNPGDTELTPENTKIEFIGTHSGDKPDPRLGGFLKFTGKASVDDDSKLSAVTFDIDADSIWTEIGDKLTAHLKNPDFFDVKEYPTIKFQSTKVEGDDAAAGKLEVTGDLTLHGVTKPVTVPVVLTNATEGRKLNAAFTIDRTQFGMTYGEGKVENKVELIVVIGEKTQPKSAAPAN